MLAKRLTRILFSTQKKQFKQVIPRPPKILAGELQPFKFDQQNYFLYEGYSIQQLYGAKVGVNIPPAIRAQMTKDNIAASLIFIVGCGLIYYNNQLFKKQLQAIDNVQADKLQKTVILPPKRTGDLH